MINQVVVLDGEDEVLGDFFSLCADQAHSRCEAHGGVIVTQRVGSDEVTSTNISGLLSKVNQQGFIFLGFVHGTPEAMVINGTDNFVSTADNYYVFSNAFLYTFSCYNGTELADKLLTNGAISFWGYSKKAWVCHAFHSEFANAALSGYYHFLDGHNTATAYERMIDDINNQIDAIYQRSMFAASTLMDNRDALILKGDKELKISDLMVSEVVL